jgi:hypothetical protein
LEPPTTWLGFRRSLIGRSSVRDGRDQCRGGESFSRSHGVGSEDGEVRRTREHPARRAAAYERHRWPINSQVAEHQDAHSIVLRGRRGFEPPTSRIGLGGSPVRFLRWPSVRTDLRWIHYHLTGGGQRFGQSSADTSPDATHRLNASVDPTDAQHHRSADASAWFSTRPPRVETGCLANCLERRHHPHYGERSGRSALDFDGLVTDLTCTPREVRPGFPEAP